MRIAACLSVKDEIEILPHQLQHLRAIGVEHVYACDFKSTDGSRALLQKEAEELIDFDDLTANEDDWDAMMRDVLERARRSGVDWIMFLDADEFWLPASGRLHECRDLAAADVLVTDRFNVALSPTGPCMRLPPVVETYPDIAMFVRPIPDWENCLTEDSNAPWITGVPVHKIMARPDRISGTGMGHHKVFADSESDLVRVTPNDLIIAHLAFSTRSRFARKIANVERSIEAHPDLYARGWGWHWGRWVSNIKRDGIEREFQRNCFDVSALQAFTAAGELMSASNYFSALKGQ